MSEDEIKDVNELLLELKEHNKSLFEDNVELSKRVNALEQLVIKLTAEINGVKL